MLRGLLREVSDIRTDLTAAQRTSIERLARPGMWWTGAERVAIAAEARAARACGLCRERKQALSPYGLPGEHAATPLLATPYVDAVHRIVTDPGRLTLAWLDGLRDEGLEDGPYIELVGIVATTLAVDTFRRVLGMPLPDLPEPQSGEPSREGPAVAARPGTAWVPLVDPREGLSEVYDDNPIAPYVRQALSLAPDEMRNLIEMEITHYLPLEAMRRPGDAPGRAIDRSQLELLAARVSYLNGCFY